MEWREVVGYEGLYEVSDAGWVRSIQRGLMKASRHHTGYMHVCLTRNGKETTHRVHTLVLKAFVGPRPDGAVCRHLDGDQTHNRLRNLCWGTTSENMQDAVAHGTAVGLRQGEEHYAAKLPDAVVAMVQAKTDWVWGEQTAWAKALGVSQQLINGIVTGRFRKHYKT